MKSNSNKILLLLLTLILITGCSYFSVSGELNNLNEVSGLKNPKLVEGELKINIRNIRLLQGSELTGHNKKRSIPEDTQPALKIWSADINNHSTQKNLSQKSYSPYPYRFETEPENGNTILYYDLSEELKSKDSIIITRKFRFVSYEYELYDFNNFDESIGLAEDKLAFYTKSERFLEQAADLEEVVRSLSLESDSEKQKVDKIFGWVRDNMEYKYPPEKRGVKNAFATLQGDCGQYTYLFVTLCRIAGIPARSLNGFYFSPDKIGYHVWSEVFLTGYGWIPVDPTDKDGLYKINGHRLIASIGNNFKLSGAPSWANFNNSEVEDSSTDFMQLATMVISGFDADITTERNIISFKEID
ncbi:MAG: hypothetical protein SCALA702_38650 [Melioribacteraceae bacterium]|nr:MAG: hypothetical protein SCALA702_38650 [Melioribacteraceae bacterium]